MMSFNTCVSLKMVSAKLMSTEVAKLDQVTGYIVMGMEEKISC